ncbi:uncharacterized protein [Panulirus ornatus]|uniref:uncharacterized protein n=1 Tax=Panulirus ornatus TaxID=150431 RepID=UPI003A8B56A2
MYKYTLLHEDSLPSTEMVSLTSVTVSTSFLSKDVPSISLSASSVSSSPETPYACPMPSSLSSSCPSPSPTQPPIRVSTTDSSSKSYFLTRPHTSHFHSSLKSGLSKSCSALPSIPLLSGSPSPTLTVGHLSRHSPARLPSHALPRTSKSAVSTLISLSTHTAIAPTGIPTTVCLASEGDMKMSSEYEGISTDKKLPPNQMPKCMKSPFTASNKDLLIEMRRCLNDNLISQVGQRRAHSLYKKHIRQNNYLIVYTDEEKDRRLGTELRRLLENSEEGIIVVGPWNIKLGELRLDGWRKLSEASRVVLVIISRALFNDGIFTCCLPELLSNHQTVPLFLECLTSEDIPLHLTSIIHRVGSLVYEKTWNAQNYVKSLQASYNFIKHLKCEIELLEHLLKETKNNPGYICPCANC